MTEQNTINGERFSFYAVYSIFHFENSKKCNKTDKTCSWDMAIV